MWLGRFGSIETHVCLKDCSQTFRISSKQWLQRAPYGVGLVLLSSRTSSLGHQLHSSLVFLGVLGQAFSSFLWRAFTSRGLLGCGCAFVFGFDFLPNSLYLCFFYLNKMTRSSPALFEKKKDISVLVCKHKPYMQPSLVCPQLKYTT